MAALEINTDNLEQIIIKGDLTFASIHKKTVDAIDFKQLSHRQVVTIDLSKVNSSDSAGLALLVEWIKLSKRDFIQLKFNHIPRQLLTLARLSGFEKNGYFVQ